VTRDDPGPVLGTGRAATVYDIGGGRVLRRYRTGEGRTLEPHDLVREADAMRWVRAHGVAAPEVFDVDGPDIVMERVEGRAMLDGLATRPHRLPAAGRILADLHRHLDAVPAPDWLPCTYPSDAGRFAGVVHGDLHPDNVILSPSGPVLIDWTNACAGDRGADLAQTWIILQHLGLPERGAMRGVETVARRVLLRAFLGGVDRPRAEAWLARVAVARLDDPNMSAAERTRLRGVSGP
jgi:aminoglycoside phosphotransferase (APT) family kinase protein